MTGTVELRHLIAGEWRAGAGSSLLSVNPARPTIVVAQGDSATTAELETAVDAARRPAPRGPEHPFTSAARSCSTPRQ